MIANSAAGTNGPGPYTGNNSTLATGALPSATPSVNIASPANSLLIAYPVNNPTSMIQQYNLSVERSIGSKTSLTIAYVGTKSDHLFNSINYSARQLGTGVYFGQAQNNTITLNEADQARPQAHAGPAVHRNVHLVARGGQLRGAVLSYRRQHGAYHRCRAAVQPEPRRLR
jgi:hypothetical protein